MKGLMGRFRVQIKPGMDIILRSTRVVVSRGPRTTAVYTCTNHTAIVQSFVPRVSCSCPVARRGTVDRKIPSTVISADCTVKNTHHNLTSVNISRALRGTSFDVNVRDHKKCGFVDVPPLDGEAGRSFPDNRRPPPYNRHNRWFYRR